VRVWAKSGVAFNGVIAVVVGLGCALFALMAGLAWPAIVATSVALAGIAWLMTIRQDIRRHFVVKHPFPDEWHEILNRSVSFYRKLDEPAKRRFERDVQIFLGEQRIYGVEGQEVPIETKLLVAASAATLSHGRPDWEWGRTRDIVVYPKAFNDEYDVADGAKIAGMVQEHGPILFSDRDLKYGYQRSADGYNVGLHELAHVVDLEDGRADGIPGDLNWMAAMPWTDRIHKDLTNKHGRHLKRLLGNYAYTNEAEFFAVSVEAFFERPKKLEQRDPELYRLLSHYFNVDPRTGRVIEPVD